MEVVRKKLAEVAQLLLTRKLPTKETHPLTPLEQCLAQPLKNPDFKGDPAKYDLLWKTWAESFIPLYLTLSSEEKDWVHLNLFKLLYLRSFNLILAISEIAPFPAFESFFDGLARLYHDSIKGKNYTQNQVLFLKYLKQLSLPEHLKSKFPDPDKIKENLFTLDESLAQFNVTAEIILERVLNDVVTEANIDVLVSILERMRDDKMQRPADEKFSIQVSSKYADSIKVKRAMKQLHKAQSDWSNTQLKEEKSKSKKK